MTNMDTVKPLVSERGPLEVVFSFDTTGSMCRWLDELRGRIQDLIQRLQADIPGIKMAVFAHGDYCDSSIYVTKWLDLTSDIVQLCKFVQTAEQTGGGDAPECYELVLRQVRTELSWTTGSRKVLVMIGDDVPHEPEETCNKDKIDWRQEVKELALSGVTIYGVQCGENAQNGRFYRTISLATQGKHLHLQDLDSLFHTLMAVCYREGNNTAMLANYEKEVRARGKLAADIDAIFASLRDETVESPLLKKTKAATTSKRKLLTTIKSLSTAYPLLTKIESFTTTKMTKKAVPAALSPVLTKKTTKPPTNKMASSLHVKPRKLITRKHSSSKVKKSLNKFKVQNLPLLKRENVPETNFSLRSYLWSPWTLALVSTDHHETTDPHLWEQRQGSTGHRLKALPLPRFSKKSQRVLYEIAVQAHKKRHVLFGALAPLRLSKRWETSLLGDAQGQVDLVLAAKCRVFVRFCVVRCGAQLTTCKNSLRRYDYAWKRVKKVRSQPRKVVKGGLCISQSDL